MSGNASWSLNEKNKHFAIVAAAVSLNEIWRIRSFRLFAPCYSGVILRSLSPGKRLRVFVMDELWCNVRDRNWLLSRQVENPTAELGANRRVEVDRARYMYVTYYISGARKGNWVRQLGSRFKPLLNSTGLLFRVNPTLILESST